MRHAPLYVADLALLLGCGDHSGLPTDQSVGTPLTGHRSQAPKFYELISAYLP